MNEERREKLEKAKAKNVGQHVVFPNGDVLIDQLEKSLAKFTESLGEGVKLTEVDGLIESLENISAFVEPVKELKSAISDLKLPSEVKVTGLGDLVNALKKIPTEHKVEAQLDSKQLGEISEKIGVLTQTVEKQVVPKQSQEARDFIPTRRVVQAGNRFYFDDNPTPVSAGGSGSSASSSSSGSVQIVDAGGEAVTVTGGKLDVNATVEASIDTTGLATDATDTNTGNIVTRLGEVQASPTANTVLDRLKTIGTNTTGAATSAKQDTVIGHLDGVEGLLTTIDGDTGNISTKIDTLAGAVSGTEMQVDVLTMPSVAVTNAGLTELAAAVNASSQVDVNIAAGNITGFATSAKQDTLQTAVDAIKTAVEILDNTVSGSETQVDVVAALPAGNNNIGDVDIASIAAGDNNIGNVDVVTLPATPAGTNAIGKLLPSDTDVTAHTNYAKKYYTSTGAATDGIVWSPAAGKRWHVVSMFINVSAAATVTLEDDLAAGDSVVWQAELAANSGAVVNFSEQYPLASGEDAADLIITTSAGNVYVTVTGYEV